MGKINKKIWNANLRRIAALVCAVGSILMGLIGYKAYAESNSFTIKDATVSDKTETTDIEIISFDDLNIVSNLTFHKLGDTATYTISLENTDSAEHFVKTITDNNTNSNISYIYNSDVNKTIAAGEAFDFVVTVKYTTSVDDIAMRTQVSDVAFTIAYDDTEETISISPDTGDGIIVSVIILSIAAAGLVISVVLIAKSDKKAMKRVAALAIAVSAVAVTTAIVKAANANNNELLINSTFNFRDKVAVTYIIDGAEETELINYGSKINKGLTPRTGYKLGGWTFEDGTVFDADTEIIDDITIVANYTPITFTVAYDGHGARKGSMESQTFTYDEAQNLAANLFKKHGFGLDKWTTTEDGEGGQSFANEQEISNLTVEDGATVTLYAQWKVMPCNPNATHFDDTVCLQDINPMTIETMPYDEQYQLRDSRDERYYDVMRMADGNIWMQEDLHLIDKTISSADSHLPEGVTFTIPASDMSAFTDDAYHPAAYYNGEYGSLYNFYTATAGWVTEETEGASPMDICPKGWRLPSDSEATLLADLYNWDDDVISEKYLPRAGGEIIDGELDLGGDDWTFSEAWLNYAAIMRPYGSDKIYPIYAGAAYREEESDGSAYYWPGSTIANRRNGLNVRCMSDKPNMQNFNKDTNAYTISEIGDSAFFEDIRNSKSYSVKKLADGNVWMTQNLDIFNGQTISSDNSNMPEGETYNVEYSTSKPAGFTWGYSNEVHYHDNSNNEMYGTYYNYHGATAGWGDVDAGNSGTAPKDVCPKGWRLPTDTELVTLSNSYSSPADFIADASLLLSGHIVNGELLGRGELDDFWTSKSASASSATSVVLGGSSATPTESSKLVDGKIIRCIAK